MLRAPLSTKRVTTALPFTFFDNKPRFSNKWTWFFRQISGILQGSDLSEPTPLSYSKVEMSLHDIVTGPFFDKYIKRGDILMISSGTRQVENCYSVRDGVLTLELDKQTYERTGLQGEPIRSIGRFHQPQRYRACLLPASPPLRELGIRSNLRLPSMLRGKKGFDRLIYAFTKVLVEKTTWLFLDLLQGQPLKGTEMIKQDSDPVEPFCSETLQVTPIVALLKSVAVPAAFSENTDTEDLRDKDLQAQLLEYIGLLLIHSPRIASEDDVDPSLCMYRLPEETSKSTTQDLVHVCFRGLVPLNFVRKVLGLLRGETEGDKTREWWTARISTFDGNVFVYSTLKEWEMP